MLHYVCDIWKLEIQIHHQTKKIHKAFEFPFGLTVPQNKAKLTSKVTCIFGFASV